jgi:hypothetical protein
MQYGTSCFNNFTNLRVYTDVIIFIHILNLEGTVNTFYTVNYFLKKPSICSATK